MRNLLIVGAAALVLGSFAPVAAIAGGPGMLIGGCESKVSPKLVQCAFNYLPNSNNSEQWADQHQSLDSKKSKLKGVLAKQTSVNLKLHGNGGEQGVWQSQSLTLKHSSAEGETEHRGRTHGTPILTNDAFNFVYKGDNNDQFIGQSQDFTGKGVHIEGTQAAQTGINIVGVGNGNSQSINQSQTINIDDSSHHHGDYKPVECDGKCPS